MKASIVILNYNGEKHLKTFLPSVIAHCPVWAEIVVADNGSTDSSHTLVSKEFPEVRWLQLDKNYGFAGGYNRALKTIDATYYAILNSDVEVTEGWLATLVDEMDKNEKIAAAQPRIRAYLQRDHFEYAGASGGFMDKYGFPFCRGRIFNTCEEDIGQHQDAREVFWATGACMVVKSADFWDTGGFDEDLFAHMEEIDFCWRLKNRNRQVYCFPEARVFHLGGGTLGVQKPHKTYLNFRNNLTIIFKNENQNPLPGLLFTRMVLDGLAAGYMLFSRGFSHFFAVMRAHFYFYTHLPAILQKRKDLKAGATSFNSTGYYRRSIVKDYFLKKRKVFGALPNRYFIRQDRIKKSSARR